MFAWSALNPVVQEPRTLLPTIYNFSCNWDTVTEGLCCPSMVLKGMYVYLNVIASRFTICLLYLSLVFCFLRGMFLIQVHLQRYPESSPLIVIFFHWFLYFPLCFVSDTWYLLICLKSELRSCSSACGWAVLLCKLAQDNIFKIQSKETAVS